MVPSLAVEDPVSIGTPIQVVSSTAAVDVVVSIVAVDVVSSTAILAELLGVPCFACREELSASRR
jgi:hypothetical protein